MTRQTDRPQTETAPQVVVESAAASCCSRGEQATCCDQSAKAECCGPARAKREGTAVASCGCR